MKTLEEKFTEWVNTDYYGREHSDADVFQAGYKLAKKEDEELKLYWYNRMQECEEALKKYLKLSCNNVFYQEADLLASNYFNKYQKKEE